MPFGKFLRMREIEIQSKRRMSWLGFSGIGLRLFYSQVRNFALGGWNFPTHQQPMMVLHVGGGKEIGVASIFYFETFA